MVIRAVVGSDPSPPAGESHSDPDRPLEEARIDRLTPRPTVPNPLGPRGDLVLEIAAPNDSDPFPEQTSEVRINELPPPPAFLDGPRPNNASLLKAADLDVDLGTGYTGERGDPVSRHGAGGIRKRRHDADPGRTSEEGDQPRGHFERHRSAERPRGY